jgi:hypothetical protein
MPETARLSTLRSKILVRDDVESRGELASVGCSGVGKALARGPDEIASESAVGVKPRAEEEDQEPRMPFFAGVLEAVPAEGATSTSSKDGSSAGFCLRLKMDIRAAAGLSSGSSNEAEGKERRRAGKDELFVQFALYVSCCRSRV